MSSGKQNFRCLLCTSRGMAKRVYQGCLECNTGFHTNCFAMFHNRDLFQGRRDIKEAVREAKKLLVKSQDSFAGPLSNSTLTLESLNLASCQNKNLDRHRFKTHRQLKFSFFGLSIGYYFLSFMAKNALTKEPKWFQNSKANCFVHKLCMLLLVE